MNAGDKGVVVTVDDAHMSEIHQVADQLRSRGMQVEGVMEAIGMITGSYGREVGGLESVPGVASVEEQTQFQLPPPDAPVK